MKFDHQLIVNILFIKVLSLASQPRLYIYTIQKQMSRIIINSCLCAFSFTSNVSVQIEHVGLGDEWVLNAIVNMKAM